MRFLTGLFVLLAGLGTALAAPLEREQVRAYARDGYFVR